MRAWSLKQTIHLSLGSIILVCLHRIEIISSSTNSYSERNCYLVDLLSNSIRTSRSSLSLGQQDTSFLIHFSLSLSLSLSLFAFIACSTMFFFLSFSLSLALSFSSFLFLYLQIFFLCWTDIRRSSNAHNSYTHHNLVELMAFQDRYERIRCIFVSSPSEKKKIAIRKRKGQTEKIRVRENKRNLSSSQKRQQEEIIRPEKKHKRCHIDRHRCLFSLFIYHSRGENKYIFISPSIRISLV